MDMNVILLFTLVLVSISKEEILNYFTWTIADIRINVEVF